MSPALNVDIHDGQETDGVSSYFHQSDLVVLDYEFSADAPKERHSLQIAKTLLTQNTHFNLIVMHTSETDLELPFNNVLRALLPPLEWLDEEAVQRGEDLAEATDAPHEVAEAMLAHVVDGGVVRAYRRTDFLEQRRALIERWADHVTGGAGQVVQLVEKI